MNVVGASIRRVGGVERVTGTQRFVADIKVFNVLHCKLVHLDCARARIRSIDTSESLKVPGVRGVVTAADLPQPAKRFGPKYRDRPLLAIGETKYHGEPVALIAADTEHIASIAAGLVKVDYEEMPAVFTVDQALQSGAPLVQDPDLRADGPFRETNILEENLFEWGDVSNDGADHHLERRYSFPIVTQFAIEPFAYIAEPASDGMTVYSATQNPYQLQRVIAEILELPLSRVRVVAPDPGGAFGGKQHPKYEPILAFFARRLGRALRLELSLEESFQAVRRAACDVRVRTGYDDDGKIVSHDIEANYLIGAYGDIAPRVVRKAGFVAAGPYRTPNVRIIARAVMSHTLPSTAFRGFGVPQVSWATEAQIDEIARQVGLDRVEIRLRNLPRKGEEFIPGNLPADGEWSETLSKGAAALNWDAPLEAGRGRGIALGIKLGPTTAASYTMVRLHMDGSSTVYAGSSDMGQGARSVFAQIASEELGIPLSKVAVAMGDTSGVPFDLQTSASRSTVYMGNAIINACRDVREKLADEVARWNGFERSSVTVSPGVVHTPAGDRRLDEVLQDRFEGVKGEIVGVGEMRAEYEKDHPLGGQPAFYELSCTTVELEVDLETGETRIHKLVVAADVGTAINPQHVSMQDEGAAVMAIGHALMEHFVLDDDGRILNLGALDYRIPTTKDVPPVLESVHIENGDGPGPYGAKGCGESGILAAAAAIAGAVEEATGCRIRDLPMTPERIWTAMAADRQNQ